MAKAAAQPVELNQQQVDMIQTWEATKKRLDTEKALELTQRLDVIKVIPFTDKEEGGQSVKLGGGWRLALDKPQDHRMEPKNIPAVMTAMDALHAVNPLAAASLIRWEPVMSVTEYKKLSDAEKLILAPVVTIKPGTPTLELKPLTVKKD
jgi:hypothetical protein